mgnify:FL=1
MAKDWKTVDDRAVKMKRIDASGIEHLKYAELRTLNVDTTSSVPKQCEVRLVDPFINMTLNWDEKKSKFITRLGTDTWESNFDHTEHIRSGLYAGHQYIRSNKSGRKG